MVEMGRADLHIHTTASDGVFTPTQVVEKAAKAGLTAIAISDHDTVGGVEEAIVVGERLGIQIVPAIEINTDIGPLEIHILGYFLDWRSDKLAKKLDWLRNARFDRARKIVQKLQALEIPITIDQVLEFAGSGSVGRPHVAQVLVKMGVVENTGAAFTRFLTYGAPAFVERTKMSPYEAIGIVIDAGGVPGLAHPGQIGRDDFIPGMVKQGLRAMEVYYSGQLSAVTLHYQALARKFGLIATGGSDAHGFNPENGSTIGSVTVDASVVDLLRDAAAAV
jgi:predicted metal-dependent phosphoesterase TrpH